MKNHRNFIHMLILAGICAAFASFAPAQTETTSNDPAFGGDFTFRKIAPPTKGTQKRITIQIQPGDRANAKQTAPFEPVTLEDLEKDAVLPQDETAPDGEDAPVDLSNWFWDVIPPDLGTTTAGRFNAAADHAENAPMNIAPRLDDLAKIATAHGTSILIETLGSQISPALVLAVISVESAGRAAVESEKGAQGLMQLIPATAERFGVEDASDPAQNIRGGVKYLTWLINHFEGDVLLALAGYNAGENAVTGNNGVPPYAETRAYVPKVMAAWNIAKALCLTPPELHSDGCVFRTSQ